MVDEAIRDDVDEAIKDDVDEVMMLIMKGIRI